MNNTAILTTPRSGSTFLHNVMGDISDAYKLGEFFHGGSNCNLYCRTHMELISKYWKYDFKKEYAFQIYQKMFKVLSSKKYKIMADRNVMGPEHLGLVIDFIKKHPQHSWSYTYQREIEKKRVILKIFHNHYNYENHFNIAKALEMCGSLILLYRENILNQYISWHRALETSDWYLGHNEKRKSKEVKITWNLKNYLSYQKEILQWTGEYKKYLSDFTHKKTAIIKYEDIDKPNYKLEIAKILRPNGITCRIGDSASKKQSIQSIDTADKFTNTEEFLDDYSKIKDKILLKIEDV